MKASKRYESFNIDVWATWKLCIACKQSVYRATFPSCLQNQSTKDVELEDQQAINRFNKLFTRSGEVEAEIKAKKVTHPVV